MDEPGSLWLLGFLIVLIGLSAFFSAAETGLTCLSKIRLRHMMEEGVKHADKIDKLTQNPNKLLSTILIGNNLVNIAATSIATSLAMAINPVSGVGIATAIMTIVILIFGEITPKTLASQNSEKTSLFVSRVISVLVVVFAPIVAVMNVITNFMIKLFGGDPALRSPLITEAELKTMVNVSHEEGVLEQNEKQMINNVFDFGDSKAKDVMTPRTDMIAMEDTVTYEEVILTFQEEQFSRLPIYHESVDNITGILHLKDIAFLDRGEFDIQSLVREPFFTYESKGTSELFTEMRTKRIPVAIILDEYGGTAGLVTIEDLVEEIVGDIADEYDEDGEEIQVVKEDEYIVGGSARLNDVNEMIGARFESEDFDTIGGYVIGLLGRFPTAGEKIDADGILIKIETVDKNRIIKLRVFT